MVILAFALGLLLGAGLVWLSRDREMAYLRTELATAHDRLLHAWKEGAVIPPRPTEIEPPPKLPGELQAVVDEWESAEARQAMELKLRRMHFEQGQGVQAILRTLENEHP